MRTAEYAEGQGACLSWEMLSDRCMYNKCRHLHAKDLALFHRSLLSVFVSLFSFLSEFSPAL